MKKLLILCALICSFSFASSYDGAYHQTILPCKRSMSEGVVLFSGNANLPLAQKIADYLQIPIGSALVDRFNDGEIQIQIQESVRNKDVMILQSTCLSESQSVNDSLMELYLMVRTMKRASAASVTAVIPYYGYARQDRKALARVPISAADVALMLEVAGIDRLITVDLHCGQIQGFFHHSIVDNLYASSVFASYFVEKGLENVVVVSPDAGGVERAKKFSELLEKKNIQTGLALISKQREKAGVVSSMSLIGEVDGFDAILIDDMCDTAGTLVKAAQLLKAKGAKRVFTVVTHPIFSGNALDKIENSVIDEMIVTDTIPLRGKTLDKITCISIAPLLGQAICRIQMGESLSELFH